MAGPSAPVGIRPTTAYLPELESLRGLAIAFVYVFHLDRFVAWAAILLLLVVAPLRSKRLFCNPILAGLGVLSYSIYMWHVPIVFLSLNALRHQGIRKLVGWHPQSAVVAAGLSAACLAVSGLTYWGIERPFLVRKARLD